MDSGFGSGFHSTIMGGQGATKTILNSHLSTGRSQRLPCRLRPARVIRGKAVQDDRLVGLQTLSPGRGESVLSYSHFSCIHCPVLSRFDRHGSRQPLEILDWRTFTDGPIAFRNQRVAGSIPPVGSTLPISYHKVPQPPFSSCPTLASLGCAGVRHRFLAFHPTRIIHLTSRPKAA